MGDLTKKDARFQAVIGLLAPLAEANGSIGMQLHEICYRLSKSAHPEVRALFEISENMMTPFETFNRDINKEMKKTGSIQVRASKNLVKCVLSKDAHSSDIFLTFDGKTRANSATPASADATQYRDLGLAVRAAKKSGKPVAKLLAKVKPTAPLNATAPITLFTQMQRFFESHEMAPAGATARAVNLVLEGVPGTGKTYALKQLRDDMGGLETIAAGRFATVMHPATSYEDFVEGLRPGKPTASAFKREIEDKHLLSTIPRLTAGNSANSSTANWFFFPSSANDGGFSIHDGFFVAACAEAVRNPNTPYVVLLDELNRCNIPKVMGDLITTMEVSKRAKWDAGNKQWNLSSAQVVTLPYSKRLFFVPDNVTIVGTMNTTDRSVAPMDAALRRRFVFVRVEPSFERFLNTGVSVAATKLSTINKALDAYLGPDAILGHSYLDDMVREVSAGADAKAIERFWFERVIFPMVVDTLVNHGCVAELASGHSKAAKEFVLKLGNEAKVDFSGRGVTQTIKLAWKATAPVAPVAEPADGGTPEN